MPDFDYRALPQGYRSYIDPSRDEWVTQLRRVETEGTAIRFKTTRDVAGIDWRPEIIIAARNNSPEWQKLMAMMGYTKIQPASGATDKQMKAAYEDGWMNAVAAAVEAVKKVRDDV